MNRSTIAIAAIGIAAVAGLAYYNKPAPPANPPTPAPLVFGGYIIIATQKGCTPCDKMKRELAESPLTKHLDIRYADVGNRTEAKKYRVNATPTAIRFLLGRETGRKEGYMNPTEFVAWLMSPSRAPQWKWEDE